MGTIDMSFGNRRLRLNWFSGMINPPVDNEVFVTDIVDSCQPHLEGDDTEFCCCCDRSGRKVELNMEEGMHEEEVMAIGESRSTWAHHVEKLPDEINSNLKPSLEAPPQMELKELPKHLKYAFLGEGETLPVIIASNLTREQEKKLMKVLVQNKAAGFKRN